MVLDARDIPDMSSRPIPHDEAKEAYEIAVLRQDESSLARCYLELHEAARAVCSLDWSRCDDDNVTAAIDRLRKMVAS